MLVGCLATRGGDDFRGGGCGGRTVVPCSTVLLAQCGRVMRCGNKSVKDVLDKSGFPDIKMGLSIDQPLLLFFFLKRFWMITCPIFDKRVAQV